MAKLIIAVDAVGVRAAAGPITCAAVLFDSATIEPRFTTSSARTPYTLLEPKKIPPLLLPHVVAHLKKVALSFACVYRDASLITNARDTSWEAMGQAAARCAERAVHTQRDALQVGTQALEIYIPPGGHCPYALVGRIGQRPVASDWRRGAAFILARAAHIEALQRLHKKYPQYEFDKNHGNLSVAHKKALRRFGRTPDHRG